MNPSFIAEQDAVLNWPSYGESVQKLDFLKKFSQTLNSEEIHHLKNLLGHRARNGGTKKRQWVGQTWEDYKKSKLGQASPLESQPQCELRPGGEKAWWTTFPKSEVVALDVEKVNLRSVKGVARVKPGKIGIVDCNYGTIFESDVYHRPGTFLDGKKDSAVSGITRYSLEKAPEWMTVKSKVKKVIDKKLVITVAGQGDLSCMDIERDDCGELFDVQCYYRRPNPDVSDETQPMSLRDIYFYHFKEDCQFQKPHNAVTDAICTMRIFLEGYIPLKEKSGLVGVRHNMGEVDFSDAIKLKNMDKLQKRYCKPSNEFRVGCQCEYCEKMY
ncbi:hypothetical protein Fcan01_23634 [Folsomia candida]|uniref:RNA exonuclease 4 n=1 Tax=Folsomia candida TaxID=158441 RepID=A0A226D8F0_FOLCA|nr:hypothetical protein Fcan01_23634 [Folsomia candida]